MSFGSKCTTSSQDERSGKTDRTGWCPVDNDRITGKENSGGVRRKRIRRAKMNRRVKNPFKILYRNIQGLPGKKDNNKEILVRSECDVCLLTETMTVNVKLHGMKSITSNKSLVQNVVIILRNQSTGIVPMKLYSI